MEDNHKMPKSPKEMEARHKAMQKKMEKMHKEKMNKEAKGRDHSM